MNFRNIIPLAGLLAMPAIGAPAPAPAVVSPDAPVPPVVYRSAFEGVPRGVPAPTMEWKQSNAQVGQFKRGHIDLLQWEAQQAASKPQPPKPAPSRADAPGAKP